MSGKEDESTSDVNSTPPAEEEAKKGVGKPKIPPPELSPASKEATANGGEVSESDETSDKVIQVDEPFLDQNSSGEKTSEQDLADADVVEDDPFAALGTGNEAPGNAPAAAEDAVEKQSSTGVEVNPGGVPPTEEAPPAEGGNEADQPEEGEGAVAAQTESEEPSQGWFTRKKKGILIGLVAAALFVFAIYLARQEHSQRLVSEDSSTVAQTQTKPAPPEGTPPTEGTSDEAATKGGEEPGETSPGDLVKQLDENMTSLCEEEGGVEYTVVREDRSATVIIGREVRKFFEEPAYHTPRKGVKCGWQFNEFLNKLAPSCNVLDQLTAAFDYYGGHVEGCTPVDKSTQRKSHYMTECPESEVMRVLFPPPSSPEAKPEEPLEAAPAKGSNQVALTTDESESGAPDKLTDAAPQGDDRYVTREEFREFKGWAQDEFSLAQQDRNELRDLVKDLDVHVILHELSEVRKLVEGMRHDLDEHLESGHGNQLTEAERRRLENERKRKAEEVRRLRELEEQEAAEAERARKAAIEEEERRKRAEAERQRREAEKPVAVASIPSEEPIPPPPPVVSEGPRKKYGNYLIANGEDVVAAFGLLVTPLKKSNRHCRFQLNPVGQTYVEGVDVNDTEVTAKKGIGLEKRLKHPVRIPARADSRSVGKYRTVALRDKSGEVVERLVKADGTIFEFSLQFDDACRVSVADNNG